RDRNVTGVQTCALPICYGNGIGWSAAGVDPGTFPFIVGLVILSGSIFNLAQGWLQAPEIVLRPSELKRLGMLFIPAAVYVGVIQIGRASCRASVELYAE